MPSTRVKGGKKLAAFLRQSKRAAAKKAETVDVGFHDPHVGRLAARLEFGDPRSSLPERPAFRAGVSGLERELPGLVRDAVKTTDWAAGIVVKEAALETVGGEARDIIKRSYETFSGVGLSERQQRRKAGTQGEGKELTGAGGPRLIERIKGRVDGKEIG